MFFFFCCACPFLFFEWFWVPRGSILGGFWKSFWELFREPWISCFWLPLQWKSNIFGGRRDSKLKLFRGLFQGSILGGLRGEIFGDFDDFGSSLGLHFGGRGWQKWAPKKWWNKCSKMGARVTRVRGCGPLKNRQILTIRPPDTGSNTPWRAWRHGGGYTYIYIYIFLFLFETICGDRDLKQLRLPR